MVFRPELLVVSIILMIVGLVVMNVHIAPIVEGANIVYWLGVLILIAGAALFIYWLYKFAVGQTAKGT